MVKQGYTIHQLIRGEQRRKRLHHPQIKGRAKAKKARPSANEGESKDEKGYTICQIRGRNRLHHLPIKRRAKTKKATPSAN
jgi:hypothetical protein